MRITRKKVEGNSLEIFQRDLFNEAEQEEYRDKPDMSSSRAAFTLGFFHSHKYVYILSRRNKLMQKDEPVKDIGAAKKDEDVKKDGAGEAMQVDQDNGQKDRDGEHESDDK